jgi:UDP:flavonoid glycosyltransferase YjiC (YdhE family)
MKLLIVSLQVSSSSSKGHFHPAFELALEAKRRYHEVLFLPLPSALSRNEHELLETTGIDFVQPPFLPSHILKSREELAEFAAHNEHRWQAYKSFLVDPLHYQYAGVKEIFESYKPDLVIYDLLVYLAPIIARELNIIDIGFCAGLKLIAPEQFQTSYRETYEKIKHIINNFLKQTNSCPRFRYLELLSKHNQLVFAPAHEVFARHANNSINLVGPLPASLERYEQDVINLPDNYAILCFGSALDPASYDAATRDIIEATANFSLTLIIVSAILKQESLPPHVIVYNHIPLSLLLKKAQIFFHHGGANSFSEALSAGVPQILIPLTNDQPIQAYYLNQLKAGFTIKLEEINLSVLTYFMKRLLDKHDSIHEGRENMRVIYNQTNGATNAVKIIEQFSNKKYDNY